MIQHKPHHCCVEWKTLNTYYILCQFTSSRGKNLKKILLPLTSGQFSCSSWILGFFLSVFKGHSGFWLSQHEQHLSDWQILMNMISSQLLQQLMKTMNFNRLWPEQFQAWQLIHLFGLMLNYCLFVLGLEILHSRKPAPLTQLMPTKSMNFLDLQTRAVHSCYPPTVLSCADSSTEIPATHHPLDIS